jgi:MFS family permease
MARQLPAFGLALTGTGLATLYLAVYAALAFYGLIGTSTAFTLMVAITVLATILADSSGSQALAVIAAAGGYGTPFLVATVLGFMSWRWAFVAFGALGVIWAVAFFRWFRDRPSEHPGVNAAELAMLDGAELLETRPRLPVMQQPGACPIGRGRLRDELGRQMKVEIVGSHRCSGDCGNTHVLRPRIIRHIRTGLTVAGPNRMK